MQVYFIDNEEYFKRKAYLQMKMISYLLTMTKRAYLFAKGVVETVKKLNWAPDIIHVHGWMASLLTIVFKRILQRRATYLQKVK